VGIDFDSIQCALHRFDRKQCDRAMRVATLHFCGTKTRTVLGNLLGLILGGLWFCWLAFIATMPVVTDVSISIVFKPWWQNWRSATVVATFAALFVTGIEFAKQRLLD
jgi:hypothetical protein